MKKIKKIIIQFKYNYTFEDSTLLKNVMILDKNYFYEAKQYLKIIQKQETLIENNSFLSFLSVCKLSNIKLYWILDGCKPSMVNDLAKICLIRIDEKNKLYKINKNGINFEELDIFSVINYFNCFEGILGSNQDLTVLEAQLKKYDFIEILEIKETFTNIPPPSYSSKFYEGYESRTKIIINKVYKKTIERVSDFAIDIYNSLSESFARRFDFTYRGFRDATNDVYNRYTLESTTIRTDMGRGIGLVLVENGWNQTNIEIVHGESSVISSDISHGSEIVSFILQEVPDIRLKISSGYMRDENNTLVQRYAPAVFQAIYEAATNGLNTNIILLELQESEYLPVEYNLNVFNLLWLAAHLLDIIIIEPVGNGGKNLETYTNIAIPARLKQNYQNGNCTDSGTIVVGAVGINNVIIDGTNFGYRVNTYLWGNTGMGTANTSGASAIATCIIAKLQSIMLNEYGRTLSTLDIRNILSNNDNINYETLHATPTNNLSMRILNDILFEIGVPF